MAYFNHAFHKCFVATAGNNPTKGDAAPSQVSYSGGIITDAGVHVSQLKDTATYGLGPGVVGFFGAKGGNKDLSLDLTGLADCCPFYLASSSIRINDKQGPFHGGYQASNKSKMVNPNYIRQMWIQEPGLAQRAALEIGGTPNNVDGNADCNKEFLCEETYYLRVEVKGTAALRFANHNLYQTLGVYTGCCDDPLNPTPVDPATVYLSWAEQIAGLPVSTADYNAASDSGNPYLSNFIRPFVIVDDIAYAQNEEIAVEEGLNPTQIWANIPATVTSAGLILVGSYVDTKFDDCTFVTTDYYGKEPIQLFASEVDLNGDPCTFEGLCVETACDGIQAQGLGETVIRDVILHEGYLQNFMHDDLRIREITQGTNIFEVIDRTALYARGFILHSVPRFNNPTGVFDNDQYLLDIITTDAGQLTTALTTIADNCAPCDPVENFRPTECNFDITDYILIP
jgi:hypothetical protein